MFIKGKQKTMETSKRSVGTRRSTDSIKIWQLLWKSSAMLAFTNQNIQHKP